MANIPKVLQAHICFFTFALVLNAYNGAQAATSVCPSGGVTTSSTVYNLTSNCLIAGNVNLSGNAVLKMTGATLAIKGNVSLSGQAQMAITSGGFMFPQTKSHQYSITLRNGASLTLNSTHMLTNGTSANNFQMTLDAYNTSVATFVTSSLSTTSEGSWLLTNFHDQSQLSVSGSWDLPTEVYPMDKSKISVTSNTNIGAIWLGLLAGSSATVNVPQMDAQGNFNFDFGSTTSIAYTVHVAGSQTRLGFNSHPNSTLILNGSGTTSPNDANVVLGYYIDTTRLPLPLIGSMLAVISPASSPIRAGTCRSITSI
jgi:hypothetical protein